MLYYVISCYIIGSHCGAPSWKRLMGSRCQKQICIRLSRCFATSLRWWETALGFRVQGFWGLGFKGF